MSDLHQHLADRGITGVVALHETGSETDRTVIVETATGRVVLKQSTTARMQAALLDAVAAAAPALPLPRVLHDARGTAVTPTPDGDLFVMTAVDGVPLEDVALTADLVDDLVHVQAGLLDALRSVAADAAHVPPANEWSIESAPQHEHLVDAVAEERHRDAMHAVLTAHREDLGPALVRMPRQVLHADANLSNVFVAGDRVRGLIDFGDAVDAPRVLDVAVTACYLAIALGSFEHRLLDRYRDGMRDALRLDAEETALVLPLAASRLVMAVVIARDTARRDPARAAYVLRYDRAAVALLDGTAVLPRPSTHLIEKGA